MRSLLGGIAYPVIAIIAGYYTYHWIEPESFTGVIGFLFVWGIATAALGYLTVIILYIVFGKK